MATLSLTIFDHNNRVLVQRITESQMSKGMSGVHLVQSPSSSRATQSMLHRTVSRQSLNMKILQSPCTTSAEPQSPSHKVMVSLKLLCFSLCPLTLVLPLDATKKSLALFLHPHYTYLYTSMRSPEATSSLGLTYPTLSAFSHRRDTAVP